MLSARSRYRTCTAMFVCKVIVSVLALLLCSVRAHDEVRYYLYIYISYI